MTGLLHISDRLLAGELSRVEAARGILCPLGRQLSLDYLRYSSTFMILIFGILSHFHLRPTVEENWSLPAAACVFCVTIINIQKEGV